MLDAVGVVGLLRRTAMGLKMTVLALALAVLPVPAFCTVLKPFMRFAHALEPLQREQSHASADARAVLSDSRFRPHLRKLQDLV